MILCKAIDKIKDKKGITVGYVLADTNGKKVRVNSKDIKKSIKEGKIEVSNLKITSDGRLMFNKNTPNHLNNTLTNFYKKQLLDVVQRICKATDSTYTSITEKNGEYITTIEGTDYSISNTKGKNKLWLRHQSNKMQIASEKEVDMIINLIIHEKKIYGSDTSKSDHILISSSELALFETFKKKHRDIVCDKKFNDQTKLTEYTLTIDNNNCEVGYIINSDKDTSITFSLSNIKKLNVKSTKFHKSVINIIDCNIDELYCDCNTLACINIDHSIINNVHCDSADEIKITGNSCITNLKLHNALHVTLAESSFNESNISKCENIQLTNSDFSNVYMSGNIIRITLEFCTKSFMSIQCGYLDLREYIEKEPSVDNQLNSLLKIRAKEMRVNRFLLYNGKLDIPLDLLKCIRNKDTGRIKVGITSDLLNRIMKPGSNLDISGTIYMKDGDTLDIHNLSVQNEYSSVLGVSTVYSLHKDFRIKITGDILCKDKKNSFWYASLIDDLVTASKINPIQVNYNTKTHSILLSAGAELEVLNADDEYKALLNKKDREAIIGTNILDVIYNEIEESVLADNERKHIIDTGISVEITPEEASTLGIDISGDYTQKYTDKEKYIIDLLTQFGLVGDILTHSGMNKLKYSPKLIHETTTLYSNKNIKIYNICIVNIDIEGIFDNYVLVINENKLIYITYLGESTLILNKNSVASRNTIEKLHKFESIDFEFKVVKQSLTLSQPRQEFTSAVEKFMSRDIISIQLSNSLNIAYMGINELKLFKCEKDKIEYVKRFNPSYSTSIATSLKSIKPVNSKANTLISKRTHIIQLTPEVNIDNSDVEESGSIKMCKQSILNNIDGIFATPLVNIIPESYYRELKSKSKVQELINRSGDIEIHRNSINSTLTKYINQYTTSINEVGYIKYNNENQYYTSAINLSISRQLGRSSNHINTEEVMNKLHFLGNYTDFKSFERGDSILDVELEDLDTNYVKLFGFNYSYTLENNRHLDMGVVIDLQTKFYYFVIQIIYISHGYITIPLFRLADITSVMLFIKSYMNFNNISKTGISIMDILESPELPDLLALQRQNISNKQAYEKVCSKYSFLVSLLGYVSDSSNEYEQKQYKLLEGYNDSIIYTGIRNGLFRILDKLPSKIHCTANYITNKQFQIIKEYTSRDSYIYLINDKIIQSDIKLTDILNLKG